MLGTVSLTMLYYLKLLTLLNHDFINLATYKKKKKKKKKKILIGNKNNPMGHTG